jgi:hypothetical protein
VSGQRDIHLLLADVDGMLVTRHNVLTEAKAAGPGTARRRHYARHHQRAAAARHEDADRALALKGAIAGFNGGDFVNPDLSVIESHTRPDRP